MLGASGYTGAEVVRLSALHPHLKIAALTGEKQAGKVRPARAGLDCAVLCECVTACEGWMAWLLGEGESGVPSQGRRHVVVGGGDVQLARLLLPPPIGAAPTAVLTLPPPLPCPCVRQPFAEVFPHLVTASDIGALVKIADVDFDRIDAVFCCLPHATTQQIIKGLPDHLKIVDLSADFRLRDVDTYAEW